MATMASTSHGLSIWANSCIKNPVNPKTGLSSSLKERSSIKFNNVVKELSDSRGYYENERGDSQNLRSSVDELQAAKEEEFYDKLQQLKNENKKTLEAYERLYQEQMFLTGTRNSQTELFQFDQSGVDREIDPGVNGLIVNGQAQDVEQSSSVFKKPPHGKSKNSAFNVVPTSSKSNPRVSQRPCSAPIERSHSLDDGKWKELLFSSNVNSDDSENYIITSKDTLSNDYEHMRAKINSMWEDFNISEPLQRRHSFSSSRKKTTNNDSDKDHSKPKKKEWRHRITVPEPFRMSIRDSVKETKKTSAQLELEARKLEKQKEEEAECEKKFKAQPAPSHIYVPLYEEIMERNNTRRKYVKQISQELLKSQVKPFNFELREQEKHHQKALTTQQKPPQKMKKPGFKANPVPKHIFNHNVDDKLNEDEELRKIRIKMRSKELLREASLPPNMAEREKLKEQERKEKARKAKLAAKKSRPKSAHTVPDYDTLYREFHKELAQRKYVKEGTVVEPFDLETNRMRSSRDKIMKDIENDERYLKENRWPYSNSRETPRSSMKYLGALSTSMDAIPTVSTKAADLRNIKVKKEKERMESRQTHDEEAEARRRAREAKLRRYLNERTVGDDVPRPKESIAARLKRIKQEDRERQEAYQRELEEMKARVDSSPLLVEKFMKENARKEAERKFKTTMRDVGLNETEIIDSHRAASIRSGEGYRSGSNEDLYGGSADLTYTKPESEYDDEAEYEY